MASGDAAWVCCPDCHVPIRVRMFPRHYVRCCSWLRDLEGSLAKAMAESVLPALPRVMPPTRAPLAPPRREPQSGAPTPTPVDTTCRFCGKVAVPGEGACYTCLHGGG